MSILVLAGNIAVLLVGWTCVGISSFLLISFWNEKSGTLSAGLQALAANAIGDATLLGALVIVPAGCGDLTTLRPARRAAGPQALAANASGVATRRGALVVVPAGCGDLTTLSSAQCVGGPGG